MIMDIMIEVSVVGGVVVSSVQLYYMAANHRYHDNDHGYHDRGFGGRWCGSIFGPAILYGSMI